MIHVGALSVNAHGSLKAQIINEIAGWGLFVCILAMLSAAAVEYVRLLLFRHGDVLPDRGHMHSLLGGGTGTRIVNLSVFWQIPQYLLVGLSEVQLPPFYHLGTGCTCHDNLLALHLRPSPLLLSSKQHSICNLLA